MLNIPVTQPLSANDEHLPLIMNRLASHGVLAGIREYPDKKGNFVREIWRQATPMDNPKKRLDNYGGVILPDSEVPPLDEFIKYNMQLIDVE